jgi:hypothetical protein
MIASFRINMDRINKVEEEEKKMRRKRRRKEEKTSWVRPSGNFLARSLFDRD